MKEIFDKLSAECSKMTTKRYSTSFSLGIYFLDKKLRDPIYAIYGFVRLALLVAPYCARHLQGSVLLYYGPHFVQKVVF